MSSILETFYILFESNAEQAKKGVKDAEQATDDFDKKLGSTDAHVGQVGEHLIGTFKEVAVTIAAAFSVEKIAEFTLATAELNDQLGKTSKRLGIGIGDLYAYDQAAQRSSGGTANFTGTLDFLNKGMADIATKGTSRLKPFFDELGIKVIDSQKKVKPLLSILGDLADKLSKMSAQQAAGIGEKLGIDEGTMLMLQSGRRAMEDLVERQRRLGTVTKEDSDIAEHFNDQWEDTKQILRGVATVVGSTILPAISWLLEKFETFTDFIKAHKGLIEGAFIGAAGVITALYLPAIAEAIVATGVWIGELLVAAAPFIAIAAAIGAVIAAFAFLYDDVQNFLAGNNSVIGELSKTWPIVGETVRAVVDGIGAAFNWLIDTGEALATFFYRLGALMGETVAAGARLATEAFEWLAAKAKAAVHALIDAFPIVGTIIKGVGDGIMGVFHAIGAAWDWLVNKIKGAIGWIGEVVKLLPKELGNWSKGIAKVTAVVSTVAQPAGAAAPARDQNPAIVQAPGKPTARPERLAEAAKRHEEAAKVHHTVEAVRKGQQQIHTANSTPIASHTSTAISNSRQQHITKKVSVTTGPITVVTQSKDPEAIGRELTSHLKNQMRQAMNHVDDGVDR